MNAVAEGLGALVGAMAVNLPGGILAGAAGVKGWLWLGVVAAVWMILFAALVFMAPPADAAPMLAFHACGLLIDAFVARAGFLALWRWKNSPA